MAFWHTISLRHLRACMSGSRSNFRHQQFGHASESTRSSIPEGWTGCERTAVTRFDPSMCCMLPRGSRRPPLAGLPSQPSCPRPHEMEGEVQQPSNPHPFLRTKYTIAANELHLAYGNLSVSRHRSPYNPLYTLSRSPDCFTRICLDCTIVRKLAAGTHRVNSAYVG